jgi:hypothetical protein
MAGYTLNDGRSIDDLPTLKLASQTDIIRNSKGEKCVCGCKVFRQAYLLRTISGLLSPSGEPMIIPVPVFVCDACGDIAPIFRKDPKYKDLLTIEEED